MFLAAGAHELYLLGPLSQSGTNFVLASAPASAQVAGSTTPTTIPSGEITVDGGPNATFDIPGTKSDPVDFYGIILVAVAIAVSIVLARWLFGRKAA